MTKRESTRCYGVWGNGMIIQVKLVEQEKKMLDRVNLYEDEKEDAWQRSNDAVCELMKSLLRRNAIPKIRIAWFEEAEHNIGSMRSRRQNIEADGFTGDNIFRHRDFKPILFYFLDGPALPRFAIAKFQICTKKVREGNLEFGALLKAAVTGTRYSGKTVHAAAEEYYKLALECDFGLRSRDIRSHIIKKLTQKN